MGVLTLILKNPQYNKSSFDLKIPNGIPLLENRISLVGWAMIKNQTANTTYTKSVKIKIPWLSSASSLITAQETEDKSMCIVIPLENNGFNQADSAIAQHYDTSVEIIPTSFTVNVLNDDNTPNKDMIDQLILQFQFEGRRLL